MIISHDNSHGLKKPFSKQSFTLPLSTAQRGQWIAQKLAPKNTAFNIAEYVEIKGSIDVIHFTSAIKQLISEADCIRSHIVEENDEIFQIIQSSDEDYFSLLDFSSASNPHQAAVEWMTADMMQPLNKPDDKLWRSALVQIGENHYYWYHRCHHVALDGFGGNLLTLRLVEIYNALLNNNDISPTPFSSIAALVESEREYKSSKRYKKDRQYWLGNLINLPETTSLSQRIDLSQNQKQLRKSLTLSQELKDKLITIGQQVNASLPQTLIALVAAYFYRMTGANDLIFAMPVTARTQRLQRNTPGMMANAVPIRLSLSTEITLEELITQVSKVVLRALRHQQYRYEDLKRELGLMSAGQQIASLGVNIEPFDYDLTFGECSTSLHNLSNALIDDLTVFIFDRNDNNGLKVEFDANPTRYTEQELENHLTQFERLVDGMIVAPSNPISKATLLTQSERHKILYKWNDTACPIPQKSVVEAFNSQSANTPKALAVCSEQSALNYSELDALSNAWANKLIKEQVCPGDLVAIALTRNTDMLVALLGTLKAGAAYLPLDPDFPEERLRSIVEDAKPKLILSCHSAISQLPKVNTPIILIDEPHSDISLDSRVTHPTGITIQGNSTAYVIYTSGSTGRPKGVEIPHNALMNFLHAMQAELNLTSKDKFLAVTTISFDISILELFLPLTLGASVVIADRKTVRDPKALTELAVKENVTLIQATPSLWQALLPTYNNELNGIRPLVGGEALPGQLAQTMAKLGHPVVNLYGPTETTIWSSIMPLTEQTDLRNPPIGRPLLNTQMYVLDHAMEPVPVGVTGDLYIAGDGLALGYYQRPDLTNERFLPNPYGDEESRLYVTGDKARWRQDGILEYQGRDDHQIKIRGFRIEIGDIESALLACREVIQAIVVAQTSPNGDKQLAAYVIPVDKNLDTSELRRQLINVLPDYMVPAHFMLLNEIPLTPNGKVDRKALPLPTWQASNSYEPPRNQLEEMLTSLWAETLGLTLVGIRDNFFEIGGDSISATRILNHIQKNLLIEVPLGVLFKASTIADLSDYLSKSEDWDPMISTLPIKSSGTDSPLFCIHPALGLSWGYAGLLRHLSKSTPVYGLQATGLRHAARLPESIEEMAEEYLLQIKRVQPQGPYRLLGWSFGGLVAHAIAEKLQAQSETVSFLCMLDSYPYKVGYQQPQNEADVVRAALLFLGYDLSTLEKLPINKEELASLLWRDYDDSSMSVVQDIQKSQADIMDRVQAIIENNLTLAGRFKPGKVNADLLFFVAEESANGSMGNILEHQPNAWASRITGQIETHNIPCQHQDMLDSEPLNAIAPIIKERIQQSTEKYKAEEN
ncbi:amino acid adenylation domain-containing protein [Marinomonas rhizomae]|uniref:amino acid adenylation domain-containing protein n=1 Tax=Marinomonas rhizomae TaxID=491948 RepID=UPI0021056320|nr:amino acid adenylation domain-containing protein [Marinomonas rhizomae]UTV98198.1 amino acid adenylation domain-containing protein [Marinomonas rhizomae]